MRYRLAFLLILCLLAGCGSSVSSPASTTSQPAGSTTGTLRAILDFGPSQRAILTRLPDTVTRYQAQVFTPGGQLLATQSGTRTQGSGSVTLTFNGLPFGAVVVRLICTDASGNLVGSQDLGAIVGDAATTLNFDTLTGGPSSSPSPASSPSPSPASSASPSPASSPAASPLPSASPQASPGASPSPAASPTVPRLVTLAIQPAPAGGPLTLQVGTSQNLQVIGSFSDGSQQNLTAQATLTSSNPLGVAIQGTLAQALSPGLVTLTAQVGAAQATLQVLAFVNPGPFVPAPGPPPPPPPAVSGISPVAGPLAGGTVVTITGSGFGGATAVRFGATPATAFTVNSDTQVTATSPAGVAIVDVIVTTPRGDSPAGKADLFSYQGAPTVTAISPVAGPLAGGTSVTITGTNLLAATAVNFGANPATTFTIDSATQITATSPAGAAGVVDVQVTTPSGTSAASPADQFTYQAAPTVTGLNPTAGPVAGGTSVVITGTNLLAATGVSFGATPAATFTVNSATQITALSPAVAAGVVDVQVTTSSGTSATSGADQFSYPLLLAGPHTFDTTAGTLDGVAVSGTNGTWNGTTWTVPPGLSLTGTLSVSGSKAFVVSCTGPVTVNGTINANGGNGGSGSGSTPGTAGARGPGGSAGGAGGGGGPGTDGSGPGNGMGGSMSTSGGGGAGHNGTGAAGANNAGSGGASYGSAPPPLSGGSGGASGGSGNGGQGGGGGGGGSVQLASAGSVTVNAGGVIDCSGGKGGNGSLSASSPASGGGGGSGGSIYLTGSSVTQSGTLNVNGGSAGSGAMGGGAGGAGAAGYTTP